MDNMSNNGDLHMPSVSLEASTAALVHQLMVDPTAKSDLDRLCDALHGLVFPDPTNHSGSALQRLVAGPKRRQRRSATPHGHLTPYVRADRLGDGKQYLPRTRVHQWFQFMQVVWRVLAWTFGDLVSAEEWRHLHNEMWTLHGVGYVCMSRSFFGDLCELSREFRRTYSFSGPYHPTRTYRNFTQYEPYDGVPDRLTYGVFDLRHMLMRLRTLVVHMPYVSPPPDFHPDDEYEALSDEMSFLRVYCTEV